MKKKLMTELTYMISQSSYPLNEFLTRMLHRYQLENVVYVIEALKKNRGTIEEIMRQADPLGDFPELKNVQPVDGEDYASLYQQVLIDLPIGNYFRKFLDELIASAYSDDHVVLDTKFVADVMRDKEPQQIKHHLQKIWLQDFYRTQYNLVIIIVCIQIGSNALGWFKDACVKRREIESVATHYEEHIVKANEAI